MRWALLAVAYMLLIALPAVLFGDNPPVRIANAVAVVFLLREPPRRWPALGVMLALAGGLGRELAGTADSWGPGVCNATETLLVAAGLGGLKELPKPWYRDRQVPRLFLTALVVPALAAAVGAWLVGDEIGGPFLNRWLNWYLASALGLIILVPLLLSWLDPVIRSHALGGARGWRLCGIVSGALACLALLAQEEYVPLLLLSFPLVLLSTWRYGLAGATTVVAGLAVTGFWLTFQGIGAVVQMVMPVTAVEARVHALQVYLAATVLSSLPFAVLLARQEWLTDNLRRTSNTRAEFLAAMSHEIRTPMTGVLGMADLLAAENLTRDQHRYVEAMRSSGRHLLNVINDILDFSRIETGKLTLEHIDFSVPELLEQVRSLTNPIAMERGLQYEVRLAPHSPPVVRGDPTRLKQILLNLVGNALKFTPEGSVSLVATGGPGGDGRVWFRFEVRDTGVGIAPEKLGQLFKPFTQADRTIAREYGGSGLGLAISKRLGEAMGGHIEASSVRWQGSVFTLHVPLEIGDPQAHMHESPEALRTASPRRILVAEDVPVNRDIIRTALTAQGHEVSFALDGAEALERVQAQPFDLVLMDVQMPIMDGVEATRRIRALKGDVAQIPIIGLTANVMAQEQARYLEAGMDACLMKPIEWDRLAAAIAAHTGGVRVEAASATSVAPVAAKQEPTPAPLREDVPLIAHVQLDSLRNIASEEDFAMLVRTGMDSAQAAVNEITQAADPSSLAAAAHRLKGSAGTLGMARLSALAAQLEAAGKAGRRDEELAGQLTTAMQETRAALMEAGMLKEG